MKRQRTGRRDYKTGGLRERSEGSWELKVRATDPKTGRRAAKFFTFKGDRTSAKAKLRDLMVQADAGALPDEKKLFGTLLDAWEAGLDVSLKTGERYRELARLHIRPHLGCLKARAITASRLEQFYADLRNGRAPKDGRGPVLAARTVGHIHRLVFQVLALAERDKVIEANPARHAKRPKVEQTEIEILNHDQVREVLSKLRGRPMHLIAALGLSTGMRRGELLALRWKDVSLEKSELQVQQSLEQTNGPEPLRFKSPKTRHGRRTISLPASIVTELRIHRKTQAEQRLALGVGRDEPDALVFRQTSGAPMFPENVTSEWRRLVTALKLPKVTMHAWRHTHASQLIASGMDVLTISRRLGHSSPSITLNIYGHLFKPTDGAAAAVFESAFGKSFSE